MPILNKYSLYQAKNHSSFLRALPSAFLMKTEILKFLFQVIIFNINMGLA